MPRLEKTVFLHMQKRRRRSAVQCFRYTDSTILSQIFKLLAFFYGCTGRFVSDLVRTPEDQFSRVAAKW